MRSTHNDPASFNAKVVLEALHEDVPVSILALKNCIHALARASNRLVRRRQMGLEAIYQKLRTSFLPP